jgi:hypothetical protein
MVWREAAEKICDGDMAMVDAWEIDMERRVEGRVKSRQKQKHYPSTRSGAIYNRL